MSTALGYLILIVLGAIGAYGFKGYIKSDAGDGILGSLIFGPALLVWLGAQNIHEISAYGISAKMGAATQSRVSLLSGKIRTLPVSPQLADQRSFERYALLELCADLIVLRPEVVPLDIAARDRYVANLTYTIRTSLTCGRFLGAVVLDKDDRYLGSFPRSIFLEASALWATPPSTGDLSVSELAKRILTTTVFGTALIHPKERVATSEGFVGAIDADSTVGTSLRRLIELNAEFLVLTTPTGKYVGVATRQAIMDRIAASLVE